MAKCLVLGANGFIGSHLVDSLAERGEKVRAFDRFGNHVRNFNPHPNIEICAGDFLNRSDLRVALKDIDYVFHFISTTTPASAENDPLIDIETNIEMTVELLQDCVDQKIKKVIFASTGGAIYGDVDDHKPLDESTLAQPVSPYAIGKLTIEHYLRYFKIKHGLDSVVFRISNPYGERQSLVSRQGVIPIFLQHIYNDEPITILGDGTMVRDYLYVKDVAELITAVFKNTNHSLYNLASGVGVSVNELVSIIKDVTQKEITVEYLPKPVTFLQHVVLNTDRFKNEFNTSPRVELEEGIRCTWEYVKSHNSKKG